MAQQVVVKFLDDLDAANGVETEAVETIRFGIAGTVYALDLSQCRTASQTSRSLSFQAMRWL
jgi:hypothetical protein